MWASPVALAVKNPPASAGDVRDMGSTPGSETSPGEGHMAIHSSILAWRIPWTEEPGGLQSIASESGTNEATEHASILFHYGLSQNIEYTLGPCCLTTLYVINCVCQSQPPSPSLPYLPPPWQPHVFALRL